MLAGIKQKRLLLLNLNELYTTFKHENPELKIGISKFCNLRPKNVRPRDRWCSFIFDAISQLEVVFSFEW